MEAATTLEKQKLEKQKEGKRRTWKDESARRLSRPAGCSGKETKPGSCREDDVQGHIDTGFEEREGGRLVNLLRDVPRAFYYAGVALAASAKSALRRL